MSYIAKFIISGVALSATLLTSGLHGQIGLTASDGGGVSSFNSGTNWDGGLAPSAGNDYINNTAGVRLRTPAAAGDYTFAGDSLTVSNSGLVFLKGGGTTTVNDLRLDGGRVYYGVDAGGNLNLAGNITLGAGGGLLGTTTHENVSNVQFGVSANISGSGQLWASIDSQWADFGVGPVSITLNGTNTYTGGTRIGGASNAPTATRNYHLGGLELIVSSSLGSGDVLVEGHDIIPYTLSLQNISAIDAGASLIISGSPLINLDYTGSSLIAGLSFDGGGTFAAMGTWGAAGSGADNISNLFSGTGTITVVPEPSMWAVFGGMLALSFVFIRRIKAKVRS